MSPSPIEKVARFMGRYPQPFSRLQARLDDPVEYINGHRRPFWETMEIKAKSLDPYAINALRARKWRLQNAIDRSQD
jgi:hypothetical protein